MPEHSEPVPPHLQMSLSHTEAVSELHLELLVHLHSPFMQLGFKSVQLTSVFEHMGKYILFHTTQIKEDSTYFILRNQFYNTYLYHA